MNNSGGKRSPEFNTVGNMAYRDEDVGDRGPDIGTHNDRNGIINGKDRHRFRRTRCHREMKASEARKNYRRPRSDESNFENVGIKTFGLWTRNSVFPVYYHDPRDKTDVLTPEIMEDAAKLLYLGILGVANDARL